MLLYMCLLQEYVISLLPLFSSCSCILYENKLLQVLKAGYEGTGKRTGRTRGKELVSQLSAVPPGTLGRGLER